jgi:hypothetical protein
MTGFTGWAALIGIYAALVFDVFSSTNSSPQTTELFARDRAGTLWKWIRIGAVVSIAFIALAVFTEYGSKREDKSAYLAPVVGGVAALAIMWAMYSHALTEGGGSKPAKKIGYTDW